MATLPKPVPGLVIRYSYLWADEHDRGHEEGRKDRPCAIVLATLVADHETHVVVLPVTHTPPAPGQAAVEVPLATKQRLGLDHERSWIVISEANRFGWPGPDLRPVVRGTVATVAYGELPADLFRKVRDAFLREHHRRRARLVSRTD
ncbi:hypothetical protein [Mesorhizobium marinum]|uniref:hypothetical protein n=1 Tax=Mesorhizobium marinum TaxID=3228790 RepID=UPI003465CC74